MRRTYVRRSEHGMKRNAEIGLFSKPSILNPPGVIPNLFLLIINEIYSYNFIGGTNGFLMLKITFLIFENRIASTWIKLWRSDGRGKNGRKQ
jgi:hypothetical protein